MPATLPTSARASRDAKPYADGEVEARVARKGKSMRTVCVVSLVLLWSPAAVADCSWIGGAGLAPEVWNEDQRGLEQVLGTPVEHVACSRIRRDDRFLRGFSARRGFLVLTKDEAVFVSDRRDQQVLFRTDFSGVRALDHSVFDHGVFAVGNGWSTQFVHVTTDKGQFRFELTCDFGAQRVVDELQRRTAAYLPLVVQRRVESSCDRPLRLTRGV
jgi:hypothetical protein